MSYKRKTADEYVLLANYGYGWDEILTEDSAAEIRRSHRQGQAHPNHVPASSFLPQIR